MGGCRCTYRNCTVKSDGSTHLFHYPVFDKYRCHKWLTNAQRLDFLNLKVSQLKNRVVCQNHFTDDMFMNFKKDKLKCSAIPTENGPFCEPINLGKSNNILYPINIEQIENEFVNSVTDKNANFSVKYGDFLTNCELMELTDMEQKTSEALKDAEKKTDGNQKSLVRRKRKLTNLQPVIKVHIDNEVEFLDKKYFFDIDRNSEKPMLAETNKDASGDIQNVVFSTPEQITMTREAILNINDLTVQNKIDGSKQKSLRSKVKILSEEPFNQPLPAVPTLTPIPTNYVLHIPERKNISENNDNSYVYNLGLSQNTVQTDNRIQTDNMIQTDNTVQAYYQTTVVEDNENNQPKFIEQNICHQNNESPLFTTDNQHKSNVATPTLPKSRGISHERLAAIQEKRKFNKKLRDIITDSLNSLDEPVNKNATKAKDEIRCEPESPVIQKQLVKYFDVRMNRMEETLLQKIDSNRKLLLEMKNVISDIKTGSEKKRSSYTQTGIPEELHKKNLFLEISKYLTADAKSLVYEELFINKHVQPKSATSESMKITRSNKRRKIK